MSTNGYLQLIVYIVVLLALAKPLGTYMARIFEGQPAVLNTVGGPFERLLYRVCGVDPNKEMHWTRYALAMLAFNLLGALAVYGLQRLASISAIQSAELRRGITRLIVQYGRELRHQHQLAGVRRRKHDELPDADGGAHGAEFRVRRDRHRRAAPPDSRLLAPESGHGRQLLGRPDAHHAVHPAAAVSDSCLGLGIAGRRADASRRIRPYLWSSRSSTTRRSSMPRVSR